MNDSDKTIHEFPCYSFVLGDLHAHVVNVMFVTFLVGMLYAWLKMIRKRGPEPEKQERSVFWLRQLLMPHILLASVFLGMFQWTNYWDFVIYFVVTGGVVLIANIIRFEGKIIRILAVTIVQAVEIIGLSYLVILPFTLKFDTMVQGVALAQHHSLWYQLLILWGLPVLLTVLLILSVITEKMRGLKHKNFYRLLEAITVPDLFAVIMGLCAIGLVLIPELVYVRDIYENGNARANTMFKLTYQAYTFRNDNGIWDLSYAGDIQTEDHPDPFRCGAFCTALDRGLFRKCRAFLVWGCLEGFGVSGTGCNYIS
mgnify:CR=1 FL=1